MSVATLHSFQAIKAALEKSLYEQLEEEIRMEEFEARDDDEAFLFATPVVDSKTVMKLSPLVEKATGQKIDPTWIKKGGYVSVEDAISDVISKIEQNLQN